MKKRTPLIALLSLLLFSKFASAQELELKLDQITTVIKSSKVGYENAYLFIGRVASITRRANQNQEEQKPDISVQKGQYIEVLADKSVCYDEVYTAFLYDQNFMLTIANIQADLFVPKPQNKNYAFFLRIVPIQRTTTANASCQLTKK